MIDTYKPSGPVRIVEEVPGCDRAWFISFPLPCQQGEAEKLFGKDTRGSIMFPEFHLQEDAITWCKARGYEYKIEKFEP